MFQRYSDMLPADNPRRFVKHNSFIRVSKFAVICCLIGLPFCDIDSFVWNWFGFNVGLCVGNRVRPSYLRLRSATPILGKQMFLDS